MFTDTHCHLYKEYYDNIDKVIKDAEKTGINRFINCGVDTKTNKEVLELSEKYNNVYAAIGIHPEYASDYTDNDLKFIEENMDKIIAVGEIGLDYHYEGFNKEKQIELFIKQIELAIKYNKPVIIHNRKATEDILQILNNYKVKGIMHCFNRSEELAKRFIENNMLLGINGVSTYENNKFEKLINNISLDNFVLETDSPYLTPIPYKENKNEPKYIIEIAKNICFKKNISLEELSIITNKNIEKCFDISQ